MLIIPSLKSSFLLMYSFFWVIPRRLKFICQPFGTLCSIYTGAHEDGTECSETSAYKIQTPENYAEESIQHSEQWRKFEIKKVFYCLITVLRDGKTNKKT